MYGRKQIQQGEKTKSNSAQLSIAGNLQFTRSGIMSKFLRVFSTEAVMGTPTFFLNDIFIGGDASSNWGEKQWNGMIDKILT